MYTLWDSLQPIWSRVVPAPRWAERLTGPRVRALSDQLHRIARETEPDFVQLAERLNVLHASSVEIGSAIQSGADAVREVLQDETLYGERGLAARLSRDFRLGLDEIASERECLQQVETALQVLCKEAGGIADVTRALNASLAGFAIETARSAASASAFGAFVDDLRAIIDRLRLLGESMSGHALATRHDLARQLELLDGGLVVMGRVAESSEGAVSETERRVRSSLARSSGALTATQAHAQRLAANAGEAVYHLQFGDIVRQKLEHAAHALEEAAGMLDSRASASSAGDILSVQSAQLELVTSEVTTACAQLSAAFEAVTAHTRDLVEESTAGAQPVEMDDCQALIGNLRELDSLQAKSLQLREQARRAAERTSEASAQVTAWLSDVESINHEMHIQALNAIIVTELLGAEGRTLGVLSTFLHQGYQQLDDVVHQIAGAIERMNHHSARMRTEAQCDAAANAEISAGIDRLASTQAGFAESRDTIAKLVENQVAGIESARKDFAFLSALTTDLGAVVNDLAQLKQDSRWKRRVKAPAEELKTLTDRYTMASEREIHRRVTANSPGNTRAEVPSSDFTDKSTPLINAQEIHGFDENIELF